MTVVYIVPALYKCYIQDGRAYSLFQFLHDGRVYSDVKYNYVYIYKTVILLSMVIYNKNLATINQFQTLLC